MKNLFSPAVSPLDNEFVETLFCKGNVRIEHIVSDGHVSEPDFWYDQSEDEWVCVIKGEARILFEYGESQMKEGDWLLIPAHKKHRVVYTSKSCHWLAIFVG